MSDNVEDMDRRGERPPGPVLVAGAAGYIGRQLVAELLDRGYRVRCLVIDAADAYRERWPVDEVITADVRDRESLRRALAGVEAAFYLIHSLLPAAALAIDDAVGEAASFRAAAEDAGVKRIIYLGSLADTRAPAGSDQARRLSVVRELRAGAIPVTELRADIIIGPGSASYEIIRNLVRRLPVMPVPSWARSQHLPVAASDVVGYLVGVLEAPATAGGSYELCGEQLTYEEMLGIAAAIAGRKTRLVSFPYTNPAFYSYTASLLTPVPDEIARTVIGTLAREVICRDRRINELVPREPLSFAEMFRQAVASERSSDVLSRWSDAWPHEFENDLKLVDARPRITHRATYSLATRNDAAALFGNISEVGGERGWLHNNWMWRLRGVFDRLIKGVGSERGRKRHGRLEVNEVIDFWRVEALEPDRSLLLRAELRLPGQGWLEFLIEDEGTFRRLSVTAYFIADGLPGRFYWYAFYPFHGIIFRSLLKGIDERSASM